MKEYKIPEKKYESIVDLVEQAKRVPIAKEIYIGKSGIASLARKSFKDAMEA